MDKETITFRMDAEKRAFLDALAVEMERDRTYLLNQAVDAYLEMHQWQIKHIEEGPFLRIYPPYEVIVNALARKEFRI